MNNMQLQFEKIVLTVSVLTLVAVLWDSFK